jgi:hypothetical protein
MFWNRWGRLFDTKSIFGKRKDRRAPKRRRPRPLSVEQLEGRVVPVVGAFVVPPPVMPGAGFDGVVRLTPPGGGTCSGSLLFTGRDILTAAHCVDWDIDDDGPGGMPDGIPDHGDGVVDPGNYQVLFQMPGANVTFNVPSANIVLNNEWNGARNSQGRRGELKGDMALLHLPSIRPFRAEEYNLYRSSDEVGKNFTIVGYGQTGTGATGEQAGTAGIKRSATNTFTGTEISGGFLRRDRALTANFTAALPAGSGTIGKGDSGGPAFIGGTIAGVNSFGRDVNGDGILSNFGDLGGYARVSVYADWIDSAIQNPYDLVLDMNTQVLGLAGPTHDLTITASRSGNLLVIDVSRTPGSAVVPNPYYIGRYWVEAASNVRSLTIRGSGDNETIRIVGPLGISTVTVDGRGGNNSLILDYSAASASTYTMTAGGVDRDGNRICTYSNVRSLTLTTGVGNDTVNVQGTSPGVDTTVNTGAGQDTVRIANAANRLDGIHVTVDGGTSRNHFDSLIVSNEGWGGPETHTITNTTYSIASQGLIVTYRNFENFELRCGNGNDTVNVLSTDINAGAIIRANGGDDTINVGNNGNMAGIRGGVAAFGGAGIDRIFFNNQNDPRRAQYTLDFLSVKVGNLPSCPYFDMEYLELNADNAAAGDTINVLSTAPATATVINAGGGSDDVNVNSASGPLSLNGQAGDDTFSFRNFTGSATIDGGPGNDTIEAAQGTLSTSQVPFSNVEALSVIGGSTLVINTNIATGTVLVQNGTVDLRGRTVQLQGAVPGRVQIQAQGILTGTGTINGNMTNAGQLRPGGDGAVGRITVSGDYVQTASGRLNLDLLGPAPGTQSDNLDVGNRVRLAGRLNLAALAGFNGNSFELVTNRGQEAVDGIFAGLPEGAMVQVGGRQFQISYRGGDGNDVVLSVPPQAQATTTAVASSANPSVFGQLVTFTATVRSVAPGMGVPTGTVVFMDGTVALGTAPLNNGVATLTTGALAVGSHTITAEYSGDASFTSSSGGADQTVNRAATEIRLTSLVNPAVYGQSGTFAVAFRVVPPGAGTPTGTVTLYDTFHGATTVLTSGPVGGPSPPIPPLEVGDHLITAVYSGDGNFLSSSSAPLLQTVNRADTRTTLVSSSNPSVFGSALTLTVTVSVVAPGAGTPSGTVTIWDNFQGVTTVLTSGVLGQPLPSFAPLAVGTHQLTVVYSGDDHFNGSTSDPLFQVILPAP